MTHKGAHNDLTAEFVREAFDYDPKTGILRWKKRLSKRIHIGDPAGAKAKTTNGFRLKVGIANIDYMVHRIIWLWMTGKWPEFEIDHKDGDGTNNRWKNLRHATPTQNLINVGPLKNNTSGFRGVCFSKNQGFFVAGIKINGKRKHLGCFDTAEEAYEAYRKAAKKFYGEFAKKHQ